MPDYADNYTARYVLEYFAGGMPHKQTWRYGAATDFGAIEGSVDSLKDIWSGVGSFIDSDLAFLGATFYPKDSDIGYPVGLPSDIGSVVDSGVHDDANGPIYISLPWTTTAGGKQTMFFYGVALAPQAVVGRNYRIESGEEAPLTAARAAINLILPSLTGNDGFPGRVAKGYFNYGVNPALVRKARRS